MSPKAKAPTSIFSRSKELLGLAAKVGRREVAYRLQRAGDAATPLKKQVDQAKMLVESLGKLKGAAMKVGQLLSLEAADLLPKEVLDTLQSLQDQAPPIGIQEIREILLREWGPERCAQVQDLSERAIAAASIGQVHRARWHDHVLALKIQYPHVAESIDSDLALLKKITTLALSLTRRSIEMELLFGEIRQVLQQEVNYFAEADALERYGAALAGHAHKFAVPQVYRDLLTARVLPMSLESGISLTTWIASQPPLGEREYVGQLLLDLYALEFFAVGLVQTDPNFGNFLYRPEIRQLVLLDFGATRAYTPEFRTNYAQLLREIREGKPEAILTRSFTMGLLSDQESPACQAAFIRMLQISIEPFQPQNQPFDFADADYAQSVREASLAFIRQVHHSAPPHELIFLHRKLGGIFNILKALRVAIDLRSYWETLVETRVF